MIKKAQEKQDGIVDGFSSDEQVKHQEIIIEQRRKSQSEILHKQQVKFKIPPPQQIKQKSYSLHPDIATGWAPKTQLPIPIPMIFDNRKIDSIVKRFLQKKQQKMKICYLGPRFENTFYAWYKYQSQFPFPYKHIKAPHNMKFTTRPFCGQHWDAQQGILFDGHFQGGNLDCAFHVGENQYDLYMRVDSNTRGHLQWFNFKIKNLIKMQKYKINICNLQKNKSLYSRGQKPYILSTKKYQKQRKGWQQTGQSIKFEQKPPKSTKVLNNDYITNYKLSFQYYTQYEDDQIQIAYCIPYTYSQMTQFITNLQKKVQNKSFFNISKLCLSLGGLEIPLITITENYNKQKQQQAKLLNSNNLNNSYNNNIDQTIISKKCIIISGRVHPGQSNGSFMMQGFLQFLCGESKQAKLLRQYFIFKIVPMLNPDGVILGNYRTGISGKDFNRQYRNPDKQIFPQIYNFKQLVIQCKKLYKQNLLMFLDFHGHSTKKNVFVYGPQFPIIQKYYYQCRVFPKLLGNCTNMFRYYSCSFKVSQFKQSTARAIFLRRVLIPLSYTIQASNGFYYDKQQMKDVPFTQQSWTQMGKKIGLSLGQYGELLIAAEKFRIEKLLMKKQIKKDIKIRKTSKNKNKQINSPTFPYQHGNNNNSHKQMSILSGNQNQKIKAIFQQIKKAEEQKQLQKNQQDNISQGDSDDQGQKDDLSPQKLKLLFNIIKNKKTKAAQKFHKKLQNDIQSDSHEVNIKYHHKTHDNEQKQDSKQKQIEQLQKQALQININFKMNPIQIQIPIHSCPLQQSSHHQQLKHNLHGKGYFLRHRANHTAYLSSQKKNHKVAAKIINFSFIGHSRPANNSLDQKRQQIKNFKAQITDPFQVKLKNNKVLDLSQIGPSNFRQTFHANSPIKQIKQMSSSTRGIDRERHYDKKNPTLYNLSPRKLGAARLEQFKYKRLFIDEYKL